MAWLFKGSAIYPFLGLRKGVPGPLAAPGGFPSLETSPCSPRGLHGCTASGEVCGHRLRGGGGACLPDGTPQGGGGSDARRHGYSGGRFLLVFFFAAFFGSKPGVSFSSQEGASSNLQEENIKRTKGSNVEVWAGQMTPCHYLRIHWLERPSCEMTNRCLGISIKIMSSARIPSELARYIA